MAIRRFSYRVARDEAGQRLDRLVGRWLQAALDRPLSKSAIRRLIVAGAVRVNGRPSTRPALTLLADAHLTATIDRERLPVVEAEASRVGDVRVLFEDAVLIAVAKPPGLPVHPTADPARADLYTLVRRLLSDRAGSMPHPSGGPPDGLPYLGLHHRLDRDTSGVVLFTTSPEANAGLAAQFEGRSVEKIYHALTIRPAGTLPASWRVESRLALVGKGRTARMSKVEEGGQFAATRFAILRRWPLALLLDARPHTGRKHQIRAHLLECGLPILGDTRYGGPRRVGGVSIPRTMLHARRLVFRHPLDGRRVEIDCEYPEDFARVLDEIGS